MDKFSVNINTKAYVVLTDRGAEILNKYHKDFLDTVRNGLGMSEKYVADSAKKLGYDIKYNQGDIYEDQLWMIMHVFGGNNVVMGLSTPFEKNEITIIP